MIHKTTIIGFSGRAVAAARRALGSCAILAASWIVIPAAAQADPDVLRVGDQAGMHASLLAAAGQLDNLPYRIEWAEFPTGTPLLEALKADAIDVGAASDIAVICASLHGPKIEVVGAVAATGKAVAIVVPQNSPIRSLADMKGKIIAITRASPGELLVVEAFRHAGLPLNSEDLAYLSPADARAALGSGAVDAWSVWDPMFASAELKQHVRVIVSGTDFMTEYALTVSSPEALTRHGAEVADFNARLMRAYRWGHDHPDAAAATVAKRMGIPQDVALRFIKRSLPQPVMIDVRFRTRLAVMTQLYADAGMIPAGTKVSDVVAQISKADLPTGK